MQKPKLHIFSISHYCEKARWALDFCGLDYDLVIVSPISHNANAKRLGLDTASLPILELEQEVLQGSDKIIAWAEKNKKCDASLAYRSAESQKIEQELDEILGVNVRKWYYSEALIDHPKSVLKVFAKGLSMMERTAINIAWPKVRSTMTARMDLGLEQGEEARKLVEQQLDKLDALLSSKDNTSFGGGFSRVELTAASLLAPLILPEQHPMAGAIALPPKLEKQMQAWQQRPASQWVAETYAAFR